MPQFGMHEAKATSSELAECAQNGEEIILTRHGTPLVRLEAVERNNRMSEARGALRGEDVWISNDFDGLPDDIAKAFGMC